MTIAPVIELPPGFRFHPTDEELVNYYLKRKIHGLHIELDIIPKVHLYRSEPWELADRSFSPSRDDPSAEGPKVEWYVFGLRDRKYTSWFRKNRATRAGYWKSTGKDRLVLHHHAAIGMKKTLVYHLGRTPNGVRTGWVMHEYRLHHDKGNLAAIQDTCALCRLFKKNAMIYTQVEELRMQETQCSMAPLVGDCQQLLAGDINSQEYYYLTPSPDVPGGPDADKDDCWMMQFVSGGASADKDDSWMQFVPGGAVADKDDSWMQFISEDAWCSSTAAEESTSCVA